MGEYGVMDLLKLNQRMGTCATHSDVHEMELLIESGKDAMRMLAKHMVAEAGAMPVMVSYSSDETRAKVSKRVAVEKEGQPKEFREGKQGYGILLQHHFIRYIDASGLTHSSVLLMEPKALQFGKSGDALLAVARDDLFVAREHGHTGTSIAHPTMCSMLALSHS